MLWEFMSPIPPLVCAMRPLHLRPTQVLTIHLSLSNRNMPMKEVQHRIRTGPFNRLEGLMDHKDIKLGGRSGEKLYRDCFHAVFRLCSPIFCTMPFCYAEHAVVIVCAVHSAFAYRLSMWEGQCMREGCECRSCC